MSLIHVEFQLQQRVEAIKRFPVPITSKELERFWGICAFSHRFVRHASGKMAPLTYLKNISRQNDFEEAWNPVHDRAFCATKEAIATVTRARTIPTWVMETVKLLE